ncbi:uncharacterized protein LOC5518031 isoform X1 [Nematostella vectensis]|uniref:uncharacterized protein LOC5518031 isoform X1 n=1 Tax=Nematostella vectensis TaxID=45351 RepID=UPI002076EF41|nr:uncharacterized protein LOC5518031 isoform X1 [Nematostella vectensis]
MDNTRAKAQSLARTLWEVASAENASLYPKAISVLHEIFEEMKGKVKLNTFCKLILDLKILTVIDSMVNLDNSLQYHQVFDLLDELFPIEMPKPAFMSTKNHNMFKSHNHRVHTMLLDLLASNEARRSYINDFLNYGPCNCSSKLIKKEVKRFLLRMEKKLGCTLLHDQSHDGPDHDDCPSNSSGSTDSTSICSSSRQTITKMWKLDMCRLSDTSENELKPTCSEATGHESMLVTSKVDTTKYKDSSIPNTELKDKPTISGESDVVAPRRKQTARKSAGRRVKAGCNITVQSTQVENAVTYCIQGAQASQHGGDSVKSCKVMHLGKRVFEEGTVRGEDGRKRVKLEEGDDENTNKIFFTGFI